MKRNISIKIKAVFLLIVFGLNTVVGFACGIGVDMGFNSNHHDEEEVIAAHLHKDGTKHNHHKQVTKHKHEENKEDNKEKKGCCSDEVQKIQSLDKALNQSAKIIDVPTFAAIISSFLGIHILNISKAYPPKYIVRFFYPPPVDIRIAIQSFQI